MDSSPVNHYLLFESADVLRPCDKVAFALRHPIALRERGPPRMAMCGERRQYLLRSVEELRRMLAPYDRCPTTPSTGAPFPAAPVGSAYSSPDPSPSSSLFPEHPAAADGESAPWDIALMGATIWRWPVEVLYQRYHLLVAIDFGLAAFEVSYNGTVLMDRVPCAVDALLGVVTLTLRTRDQEVAALRRWMAAQMDPAECEAFIRQVWQPAVDVSVVLVNVPRLEVGALASITPLALEARDSKGIEGESEGPMCFLPADAVPFPSLECDAAGNPSVLPLLTDMDAARLLRDKEFVPRLEATLRAYEAACRARLVDEWPDRALLVSMEHIVRLVPERPARCTSLVLIGNADRHASHESVALLESEVRRKSIIVSFLSLGEAPPQDGPQTSPLSQFTASVGGLAVHLDYWLALAAPRINADWCRRFEGPRCLAQQLFVKLDNKFPVAVARAPRGLALRHTDICADVRVLYDADNGLPDFSLRSAGDVHCVLSCAAEARVAQGWSVVMEQCGDSGGEAHLYARFHPHLRRGAFMLAYELDVCYPVVRRRVLAFGTRALLEAFCYARDEDSVSAAAVAALAEAKSGWLAHLLVLRAQLHAWVLAEEAALYCLLAARAALSSSSSSSSPPPPPLTVPRLARRVAHELLPRLSSRDGVAAAWAAHCSQRAVGLFFRRANSAAWPASRGTVSAAAVAGRVVRDALRRRHWPIAAGDDGTFIGAKAFVGAEAIPPNACVVQVFAVDGSAAVGHDGGTHAAVIECRVSFFLSDSATEQRMVDALVADVQAELAAQQSQHPLVLTLEVGDAVSNARALHLSLCVLSPRRIEFVTPYAEARRPISTKTPFPAKKNRATQQLAVRSGFAPYVVSPWVLADAVTFHWAIGAAEVWRTLGEPCFHCFVTRRERSGFRLVYCSTQRRAILHATRDIHENSADGGAVDIFDVIDAPLEGGDAAQVIITRCIRPFWAVLFARRRWELTADISEDIKAATVLHTFSALAAPAVMPLAAERTVSARGARRGVVQLTQRLDALLPFLPAAHAHTVALPALPSLGASAMRELRGAVVRFVGALAERSATVSDSAVQPALRQRLFPPTTRPSGVSADISVDGARREDCPNAWANTETDIKEKDGERDDSTAPQLFVAMLRSPRSNCLTFILIPCAEDNVNPNNTSNNNNANNNNNSNNNNNDMDDGAAARDVVVTVVSLDAAALQGGVMSLFGRGGVDEPRDCTDPALLDALARLLSAFSALYQASRLLERQREGAAGANDANVARDLLRVFATFQDYCTEVDVSHLLYVTECGCTNGADDVKICDALSTAVAKMVRAMSLQPLLAHPSVFYPSRPAAVRCEESEDIDRGRVRNGCGAAAEDPAALPFLAKMALLIVSPDGREESAVWVSDAATAAAAAVVESAALPVWGPTADAAAARPLRRLLLRLYVRTAPPRLVDLPRDGYCPPVDIVRRSLADLLADAPIATRRDTDTETAPLPPSFFAADASVAALSALHRHAQSFAALPDAVRRFFDAIAADLTRGVARHCLAASLRSGPLAALRAVVEGAETESEKETDKEKETLENEQEAKELAQPSRAVLRAAADVPGLHGVLAHAVTPALLSDASFEADSFAVEFTQQLTYSTTVDPTLALLHVLTRCLADDLVCVVPATPSCFLYVPNRAHLAAHWVLVQLTAEKSAESQRVSLRCHEHSERDGLDLGCDCSGRAAAEGAELCSQLRRLITAKATEVSQLHLFKQLRDTQNAHRELIPPHWGDQYTVQQPSNSVNFASPPKSASGSVFTPSPSSSAAAAAVAIAAAGGAGNNGTTSRIRNPSLNVSTGAPAFYCRGVTALEIPVYYKLQHQCKKMLSRIASNSSRLELITIYNREQCFVVADDVQEDAFHYVRLVFVKDTTHPVSFTAPSPPLSPADRCPILSVQLFSATRSASVNRPLRKLRDFCFFLAVQELQGHLNYVQHKVISAVDLMFLQYRSVDPVSEDLQKFVGDGETLHAEDVHLAFALIVLGLKENKFKYFEVQDRQNHHTVSNFIEYYRLLDGGAGESEVSEESAEATEAPRASEQFPSGTAPGGAPLVPREVMRFVKTIEGVTDVLVSCSLRVTTGSRLIVDRFLSKLPEERYITGESEKTHLKQIDDVVNDAILQWRFSALSRRLSTFSTSSVVGTVEQLLDFGAHVASTESSTLRFKHFSLERVNPVVYPFLIERIAGVFDPLAPICFESRADGSAPSHLSGFPWRWVEQLQVDPLGDQLQVYITCGYDVTTRANSSDDKAQQVSVGRTRVLRVAHTDLPVTAEAGLAHSPLLKEHNIIMQCETQPRVVVRISLVRGVTAALFNLRDSVIFLRLVGHVIAEAEQQSELLYDIMMQRMGFAVPSSFTETALARMCCGDDSNVTDGMPLKIHDEKYSRRLNHVRFPLKSSAGDGPFTIIVEGLFNRGLIVNGSFGTDDAIKVLYDECPEYSLRDCQRIVLELQRDGVFFGNTQCKVIPRASILDVDYQPQQHNQSRSHHVFQSFNSAPIAEQRPLVYSVSNSDGIPDDALIGCSYRRHVQLSHIVVESHHARSALADTLKQCESHWSTGSRDSCVLLAKAAIVLQQRSKQVFGSRVPDFSLCRAEWSHGDEILDPALPSRSQQSSDYVDAVDAALLAYVQHLQFLFPGARVIGLDPNDKAISSDPILHHRLSCRYGKVVPPNSKVISFLPHLYYVLVPIVDVLQTMGGWSQDTIRSLSIAEGGLLVVELGYQVVHFALDVFMVKGKVLSAGVVARAAAWLKQSLNFSSILYDLTVGRLLRCVQMYAPKLSGERQTSAVLEDLMKYYPNPLHNCLSVAASFNVREASLRRMRRRMARGRARPAEDGYSVQHLVPDQGGALWSESARELYDYGGLMVWDAWRLFVLVAPARDMAGRDRTPRRDLRPLVREARRRLMRLLLSRTLQERLDGAWERIVCPQQSRGVAGGAQQNPHKHDTAGGGGTAAQNIATSAAAEEEGEEQEEQVEEDEEALCAEDLRTVEAHSARVSLAAYVEPLALLRAQWANILRRARRGFGPAHGPQYALHLVPGDASPEAQHTGTRSLTLTIARARALAEAEGMFECFAAVVFADDTLRDAALYRKDLERSTAVLSEDEADLVERLLKVLACALWSNAAPSPL